MIGASGFVGARLHAMLRPERRWGTFRSAARPGLLPLDVRDADATAKLLRKVGPRVVYVPAALPNVDWCEDHPEACRETNVKGVANVAGAAAEVGAKLVHFSTDYVFDGEAGPYVEEDAPRPVNVYGASKLAAERLVQAALPDALVVRTTVVYGPEPGGKNFVARLRDRLSRGLPLDVARDQVGSPTHVDSLAAAAIELAERGFSGVYHVAGPEVMDRFAFARLAAQTFGLDAGLLRPVATADLRQRARRPLRAGLDVGKARRVLGTALLSPREGLRRMLGDASAPALFPEASDS